jgi:hypothetical protein
MTEAARILALLSALSLVGSVLIWATLLRGPLLQRLDGRRVSNAGAAKFAMNGLASAFGLSAAAAVLGIAGWLSP